MGLRYWALLLVGLVGAAPLTAHPHVWVDSRAEIVVTDGFVEGVWAVWTFDDVFSELIVADNPTEASGQWSPASQQGVKKSYFDNLKGYEYFTHVTFNGKDVAVPTPQRFSATIGKDRRVTYRFFLPLGLRLGAKTPLGFAFYDETFFTDMVFAKTDPVKLTVSGGKASVSLRPDKTKTFYGGQVTPVFAFLAWGPS